MIKNTDSKSTTNSDFQQDKISDFSKCDMSETEKKEEILDLTNVLGERSEGKEEELVDLSTCVQEVDDLPIEDEATRDEDSAKGAGLEPVDEIAMEIEGENKDDIAGALGMSLNDKPDPVAPEFSIGTPLEDAITPEVLEDALERVIMRMFSEKIEPLLVEAVERGVQKEIERLRALILEDTLDARKP